MNAGEIGHSALNSAERHATMPRDRYQTVQEVADRLQINEATVRGWIREGALRAIEVGKGWRIADSDLDAFLCSHATRPRQTEGDAALSRDDAGSRGT